jgi:DNA excision repair protein ERCC-3
VPDQGNPLIVQSDSSLLLEVHNPKFEEVRNELTKFAELVKSPEHIHTYQLSALSLWNAAAAGIDVDFILSFLNEKSKFDIPSSVITEIKSIFKRFGLVEIHEFPEDERLLLKIKDQYVEKEVTSNPRLKKFLLEMINPGEYKIDFFSRGELKVVFFKYNIPVHDIAGYTDGEPLEVSLLDKTRSTGKDFGLRDYQQQASEAFYQSGTDIGGHGTVVLPCGAGKTIVALDVMAKIGTYTLILTTSVAAVHQWIREILDKTSLTENEVGEYTGDRKEMKPVIVCTYQILIYRKDKNSPFPHFGIFQAQKWGLIIYDEVHLLPAPVFKITSEIQSTRRLGLTATLVREDEHESDVFCLIGPKKYDTPWKTLEKQGWISKANCYEIKLPLPEDQLMHYLTADQKEKFNLSAQNPYKKYALKNLLFRHENQLTLIIGHFIKQLQEISELLDVPLITGKTPNSRREVLYNQFKSGELKCLVVSKVANFSIDLPNATVLIQVSGTYGSRQEEAQRLGRILRPKEDNNTSYFYSITTQDSIEEQYSHKRQRFLTEQGYSYDIDFWAPEEFLCHQEK